MIRAQRSKDPETVDWALPAHEVGPAEAVLELRDVVIVPGQKRRAHCPVCGDVEPMQLAVGRSGDRYDCCVGDGLLWHVDRDAGLVIGNRFAPSRTRRQ